MSFELQRKLVMSNVFKDYYRDAMDGEHTFKVDNLTFNHQREKFGL